MKSFIRWTVVFSLVVFLVGTPTNWAQESHMPPLDCENDRSVGACMGELLDLQLDTIDEVEGMLMDMKAMNIFSFSPEMAAQRGAMEEDLFARINTLRNEHGRAMAANGATKDSEFDEMLEQSDMEKGKNCKLSDKNFVDSLRNDDGELDAASYESIGLRPDGLDAGNSKFNNGKCDIFTAMIDNPGGDDDGDMVRVNERKENMCEKACKEKMVGGMPQMGQSKDRFVDSMLDAISTAQGAKQVLSAQKGRMSELRYRLADLKAATENFQLSRATAGPVDPCAPGAPGASASLLLTDTFNTEKLIFDIVITTFDGVLIIAHIVAQVLDTVADVAENPCRQTAVGFNGSTACIPPDVVKGIAGGIADLLEGIKDLLEDGQSIVEDVVAISITDAEIADANLPDESQFCSKQIRDEFVEPDGAIVILQADVTGLKVAAGDTATELTAIKAELAVLKSLLETNRELLLTPHGQRKKP